MLRLIIDNSASIIVVIIIAALALAAVRKILKDKKAGIHHCGGNCTGCSMSGMCNMENRMDREKKNAEKEI